MEILLAVPPVTKACEPPAGVARLAAALQAHGQLPRAHPRRLLAPRRHRQLLVTRLLSRLGAYDDWLQRAAVEPRVAAPAAGMTRRLTFKEAREPEAVLG